MSSQVTKAQAMRALGKLLARSLAEGRQQQRQAATPKQNRNLIRNLDRALSPKSSRLYHD